MIDIFHNGVEDKQIQLKICLPFRSNVDEWWLVNPSILFQRFHKLDDNIEQYQHYSQVNGSARRIRPESSGNEMFSICVQFES